MGHAPFYTSPYGNGELVVPGGEGGGERGQVRAWPHGRRFDRLGQRLVDFQLLLLPFQRHRNHLAAVQRQNRTVLLKFGIISVSSDQRVSIESFNDQFIPKKQEFFSYFLYWFICDHEMHRMIKRNRSWRGFQLPMYRPLDKQLVQNLNSVEKDYIVSYGVTKCLFKHVLN
jgi:hypothetical protein